MPVSAQNPSLGRPEAPDWRTALKCAKVKYVTSRLKSSAPPGAVWMEDSIRVSSLQPGLSAYAGYTDGLFANFGQLKARFPSARLVSITVTGANGAMCIDMEPGNPSPSAAPGFFRNRSHGGAVRPWLYCPAGWMTAVEDAMDAAGIARDEYFLFSAHYIGQHFCGPSSCGYGRSAADATQYASNASYDMSVCQGYVFAAPTPNPYPTLREGATDGAGAKAGPVHTLQERLNAWHADDGYAAITADGDFGASTLAAVKAFQLKALGANGADGIAGPDTWAALRKNPPANDKWEYLPPRNLKARGGHESVFLSWEAPAGSSPPGGAAYKTPASYIVDIYPQDHGIPWKVVKSDKGVKGLSVQLGGLPRGEAYIAHVLANGAPLPAGTGTSQYAAVNFRTG